MGRFRLLPFDFSGGVEFRLNAVFIVFLTGMARSGQRVPTLDTNCQKGRDVANF